MANTSSHEDMPVLYREHLLLGARFADKAIPLFYGDDTRTNEETYETLEQGALLSDVSHMRTQVFWDGPCQAFCEAAFAGRRLGVGECAFEAVLTGNGAISSVPLLARTGTSEYVAFDLTPRAEILTGWLEFLRNASQDGYAPFASVQTQDATSTHVKLVLWGTRARAVLSDYLSKGQALPAAGTVASVMLDRIPCIILGLPGLKYPGYLILVPPNSAVALWRSLLSFGEVEPFGTEGLDVSIGREFPWYAALSLTDVLALDAPTMRKNNIVRQGDDFVGARALQAGA